MTKIPTSGPIKINLVHSGSLTRFPCDICGGYTEKVMVHAMGPEGLQVCEKCLKSGDIDARLEAHIARKEAYVQALRALIGRLQVPSYQQWALAEKRCDDAYGKDLTKAEYDALLDVG